MCENSNSTKDFIVSDLLKELKEENARKDNQLRGLHKVVRNIALSGLLAMFLVICCFLLYLNQYDFSSTESSYTSNSAEGVYAIIDSDGNIISQDIPPELIQEVLSNGKSDHTNGSN